MYVEYLSAELVTFQQRSDQECENSPPDSCPHVTTASSKKVIRWTGGNRNDRVLVTLKHHLGIASDRVPELNTTVLGTTHHPVSVRRKANAENEVLLVC